MVVPLKIIRLHKIVPHPFCGTPIYGNPQIASLNLWISSVHQLSEQTAAPHCSIFKNDPEKLEETSPNYHPANTKLGILGAIKHVRHVARRYGPSSKSW